MKEIGVVRKIDELGRVVIPKEMRRSLGIRDGESLEIFVDNQSICLKKTSLLLSFRIPPHVDPNAALAEAESVLTTNVPFGAVVTLSDKRAESGVDVPALDEWLEKALNAASIKYFGNPSSQIFEGATIGTMKDFHEAFPNSPFLNTGVLGPKECAHAPNESINLDYAVRLTKVIADIVSQIPKDAQ